MARATGKLTLSSGTQLLSVETFPLMRVYDPTLFPKVRAELDRLAGNIARRAGGRLTVSGTALVADRRVRRYEIALTRNGERLVERIAFVLAGRREYQLLCRFRSGESDSPCARLLATFALA